MTFNDKIEILLRRKGWKKTEFADMAGITYRALANYMSGTRKPRKAILAEMERILGVPEGFLFDDGKNLILNSEERFFYESSRGGAGTEKAMALLKDAKALFSGDELSPEDKQSLFSRLTEIYFDAANRKSGG